MSKQFAKAVKAFVDAKDLTISDLQIKTGLSDSTCRQFVGELEEEGLLAVDKAAKPFVYFWLEGGND